MRAKAMRAKARRTEAAPSEREGEEHNFDHAVFGSWRPGCTRRSAESYGHVKKVQNDGEAPTVRVDYVHTHSEQEKDNEKGVPIVVAKDKTKTIEAKVVPGKGVDSYTAEVLKRMAEKLGYKKVILRSDSAPALLALKQAVRRERDVDIELD